MVLRKCGADSLVELYDFSDWSLVEVSNGGHGFLVEQCKCGTVSLWSFATLRQSHSWQCHGVAMIRRVHLCARAQYAA